MTEFSARNLRPLVSGLNALARGTLCGLSCLMLSLALAQLSPDSAGLLPLSLGVVASFLWAAAGPFVCLLTPFRVRYRVAMAVAILSLGSGFLLALLPERLNLGGVGGFSVMFSIAAWFYSLSGLTRELEVPRARRPLLGSLILMLPVPLLAGASVTGGGAEWMFLAWSELLLAALVHCLALWGLSRGARRKLAELQPPEPQPLGLSRAPE